MLRHMPLSHNVETYAPIPQCWDICPYPKNNHSFTCSPSLICRGVVYLRKPHYMSPASDPRYQPMKVAITKYKMLLNCFACNEQSDWTETRIYHIIICSWYQVTNMWPIMVFHQIYHATTYSGIILQIEGPIVNWQSETLGKWEIWF
jgi:hypothetical protein